MPPEPLLNLPRQCYNLPQFPIKLLTWDGTKQRILSKQGAVIADLPDMTSNPPLTNTLGELFACSPELAVDLQRHKAILEALKKLVDEDLTLCNPVVAEEKLAAKIKPLHKRLQVAWVTCLQVIADCWQPKVEHYKGQAEALNRVRQMLADLEGKK